MKVVVLIPAYNPDELLIKYINELNKLGIKDIIVVNDGSKETNIFNKIKDKCILINHEINKGKGNALKTGFKYYLDNYKEYYGVVSADDDGQHSPKDTYNVMKSLEENKDSLILGMRCFNEKQVPFKSKYGNKITTYTFERLYKKRINDTQTGLRGYPNKFIKECINIEGSNFEYEINVLIDAVKNNIDIKEIPIDTIYINNNEKTRFKGFSDSIKIYKLLFKKRK